MLARRRTRLRHRFVLYEGAVAEAEAQRERLTKEGWALGESRTRVGPEWLRGAAALALVYDAPKMTQEMLGGRLSSRAILERCFGRACLTRARCKARVGLSRLSSRNRLLHA